MSWPENNDRLSHWLHINRMFSLGFAAALRQETISDDMHNPLYPDGSGYRSLQIWNPNTR